MKKTLLPIVALTALVSACATMPADPTLAQGVQRLDTRLYSVSEMQVWGGNLAAVAVRQCQMDGGQLNVISNTSQTGVYSGNSYAVLVFRCD